MDVAIDDDTFEDAEAGWKGSKMDHSKMDFAALPPHIKRMLKSKQDAEADPEDPASEEPKKQGWEDKVSVVDDDDDDGKAIAKTKRMGNMIGSIKLKLKSALADSAKAKYQPDAKLKKDVSDCLKDLQQSHDQIEDCMVKKRGSVKIKKVIMEASKVFKDSTNVLNSLTAVIKQK
jgi:hypothetical protein